MSDRESTNSNHSESYNSRDSTPRELLDQLEMARRKLVETGTRNRLIHVNRKATRANVVNIVNERSDDIYKLLKTDGKRMKFWATGKDRQPSETTEGTQEDDFQLVLLEAVPELAEDFDEGRYTDDRLETRLGPNALQKRLLKMFRDARTAEEEQGINILYLALGFLRWFESESSEVMREAPLILLPVDLVRNHRTSTYDLVIRDDEIVTNLPLQERLEADFGVTLPEIEAENGDDWSPSNYFDAVEESIGGRERWAIDRDGMQLGFFSFAKLLMLRDLDPVNWPDGEILNAQLLQSLMLSTIERDTPIFADDDDLDEKLDPEDIFHVLDADRSQAIVIEEVRNDRNLVVQGPPGTGKSQTITNIIAAAVNDGKRVLFVAEKMAALSVVHDRLLKSGLEHVALELHSKAANKKVVLEGLARTLTASSAVPDVKDHPERVRETRDRLNSISHLLHRPVDGLSATPFEALAIMSRMIGRDVPSPRTDGTALAAITTPGLAELNRDLDRLGKLLEEDDPFASNPFRGAHNSTIQPADLRRHNDDAETLARKTAELDRKSTQLMSHLRMDENNIDACLKLAAGLQDLGAASPAVREIFPHLYQASDSKQLHSCIEAAVEWQAASSDARFSAIAFEAPLPEIRLGLAGGVGSFWGRLSSKYRTSSRTFSTLLSDPIPKRAEDRVFLIDELRELQSKRADYLESKETLKRRLGDAWAGDSTDFPAALDAMELAAKTRERFPNAEPSTVASLLHEKAGVLGRQLEDVCIELQNKLDQSVSLLELDINSAFGATNQNKVSLNEISERWRQMAEQSERYDAWCQTAQICNRIEESGLGPVLDRLRENELSAPAAKDEIAFARAESIWKQSLEKSPELQGLDRVSRHELVEAFQNAEKDRIETASRIIAARHLASVPSGAIGEMGFIRSQIARKRGHAPIRKLIKTAGRTIQQIRPVFMMSPISVAQFIPPGSLDFDLLVIDEASQVKPEDAFGAIARCRQIVVVGDQKQLPPTAFFDRMTSNLDDDEEDEEKPLAGYATEAESILSLCDSRQLPSRMLSWHYRSRDPSLIRVSDAEFYEGRLVLPPSPLENDIEFGMRFIPIKGVYTPRGGHEGKPGSNLIEAEAVVDAVKKHARDFPEFSLGIATFNISQRDRVNEILERERRSDSVLDEFLREGRREDVFVKNIENVQGDERDVIFVSVGYGPRIAGQRLSSTNFGPVNRDGGGRRLNVLFSRARIRCDIFCSFEPGDIAIDGKPDGVRIFKRYLEFAKTGVLDQAMPSGGEPDSPFEEDVAAVIRDLGYSVDYQVGSAGFLIDLAVKHPSHMGQYMLAVECDGATYHSALWSRERDRLRQEVLEGLGWRFHRIWSTDWFYRRDKEKQRLKTVLEAASSDENPVTRMKGANQGATIDTDIRPANTATNKPADVDLPEPKSISRPYKRVELTAPGNFEPHDARAGVVNGLLKKIILAEGPLHQEEIGRRYSSAFGKSRAGGRIQQVVATALRRQEGKPAQEDNDKSVIVCDGEFWMTQAQKENPPIRNRAAETSPVTKADMIPPIEIAEAARLLVSQSGSVGLDELVTQIARELGFERTGPDLRAAITRIASAFAS